MHATIVMPVIILGKRRVKPSALFAKLFEVTPRITARSRNPYEVARLIYNLNEFEILGIYIIYFLTKIMVYSQLG